MKQEEITGANYNKQQNPTKEQLLPEPGRS